MATSATPSKLNTAERTLITQALNYFWKGTNRAITSATEPELKEFHTKKAREISNLTNKLNSGELDL